MLGLQRSGRLGEAPDQDLAMVIAETSQDVTRDYSRSAQVLIAIQLRLLENEQGEENDDEPHSSLREGLD